MIDLISELEAATEGNRDLNGKIWWLVDRDSAERAYWNAAIGPPQPLPDKLPSGLGWLAIQNAAPNYTASLDAALILVPEGWGWLIEVWQREESWAQIVQRPKGSIRPSGIFEGAEGKTPAVALCIAVLKARQDEGD